MTTDYGVRIPSDPWLYTDAMKSVAAADEAITTAMTDQAKARDRLRQIERQLAEIRTDIAIDVADEAANGGRGTRLGNAEGREAEVQRRLWRHPVAQQLTAKSDETQTELAACEIALDAAVRRRKGALAALQYAASYLAYLASGEKS